MSREEDLGLEDMEVKDIPIEDGEKQFDVIDKGLALCDCVFSCRSQGCCLMPVAAVILAGQNIRSFDCVMIKVPFKEISQPTPTPVELVDSSGVLFLILDMVRKNTGLTKMNSLLAYKNLDDVSINLEVLKHCATVLFLGNKRGFMADQSLESIQPVDLSKHS
ncbi:hypothetical protein M8C21_009834 [Ambrosia artemisiifolia]|uniref:Uncharacterized protein n=1 Tax=Ambrosia artemisiifolia TaxID=4212 RepID=A0AAD5C3Q9_AMBAR|nr:hypothetical protein M8C21_009834 [Ambrosia artemisiifolia]